MGHTVRSNSKPNNQGMLAEDTNKTVIRVRYYQGRINEIGTPDVTSKETCL